MLVLRTLRMGELHGYGIAQSIRQASNEALLIEAGSLYPALQRLELQGWIKAEWKTSDTGRRARFYKLTSAGRKKSDTPREAGGLMSWTASKAVGLWV